MRKVSLILVCFLMAIQACKVPPELNTEKSLGLWKIQDLRLEEDRDNAGIFGKRD